MSILITTPTGNIGKRALQQLLNAGADISIIVRQPEKIPASVLSRVKVHQGSLTDAAFVTKAFQGAQAVLWVTPSDITHPDVATYHRQLGEVAAQAVKENKVPHVVNISSTGAHLENAGPVSGVGEIERLLSGVAENITNLRPGFFMENYLAQLESIKTDSAVYFPFSGNIVFPMIATQDIGDVAAELLLKRDWHGQNVRVLSGPDKLTFAQAAQTLGDSIGKTVRHVEITPDQAYQAFLEIGCSPGFAKSYIDMYQSLTPPGALAQQAPPTITPTTLREWGDTVLKPLVIG